LKEFSVRSFYRALNCLKGLDLIREREDGKYELIEGIERWQIFLDENGYKIKLEHSRVLLRPFIEPLAFYTFESIQKKYSDEYLLQHLESGYPDIYAQYEEWQKGNEKAYFEYEKKIEELLMKVKHGEPLKGYCELCPRVEIKN
jgi:hypothetical protein